jgi:hypothetical protein
MSLVEQAAIFFIFYLEEEIFSILNILSIK